MLTGPGNDPVVNIPNTKRLSSELKPYCQNSLLVHGTGNFGKPPARKYGYYHTGIIPSSLRSEALEIKQSLKDLNQQVIDILDSENVASRGIDIEEYYDSENLTMIRAKLQEIVSVSTISKVLPVFFGDLVELADGSFKVISSDQIVLSLAKLIRPKSVIFLTSVDGVLLRNDVNGKIYVAERLNTLNLPRLYADLNDDRDVSGGMTEKVKVALEISEYCKFCFIGNGFYQKLLSDILDSKKVKGTFVNKD